MVFAAVLLTKDVYLLNPSADNKQKIKCISLEDFSNFILDWKKKFVLPPFKEENDFIYHFMRLIKNSARIDLQFFNDFDFNSNIEGTLQYYENNTISFSKEIELRILSALLNTPQDCVEFCRYTSMATLTRYIDEEKDSVCSLAVMNDKSELDYVDKHIIGIAQKPNTTHVADFFINSFCHKNKEDNLTMWRLYGDDGKNLCLVYEVDTSLLTNGFVLGKVIYNSKLKSAGRLPSLIKFVKLISRMGRYKGRKFKFTYLDILKHFIKPEDFEVEEEYRLLYYGPKCDSSKGITEKWIFNNYYHIYHNVIEFSHKSNLYPLKLKKVILGPKFMESDVNIKQIKYRLKEVAKSTVDVVPSKIDFYR